MKSSARPSLPHLRGAASNSITAQIHHLNLNNPIINSFQDVAWVFTEGEVRFGNIVRPLRFPAVPIRKNDKWLFRDLQFHWDNRDPMSRKLLHPDLYLHTLCFAIDKLLGRSGSSPNTALTTAP